MTVRSCLVAGTLNPFVGVGHMLSHPFVVRAFVTGGVVAASCGLVGYFLVLRAQVFAGDALSHVAFTGALAALAAGVDLRLGLFAACVAFALAMTALSPQGHPDDVVIGNVFAWVLGLGALFLTLYTTRSGNGKGGVSVLFGSVFGITATQALVTDVVGIAVAIATVAIARPLLFASIDETVATAAGVPVTALGLAFMVLAGVTAGEATQVVGSLLLLGLLAGPAATAHLVSEEPWRGVGLSVAISVLSMWLGLAASYAFPKLPASFCVLAVATSAYVVATSWSLLRDRARTRRVTSAG